MGISLKDRRIRKDTHPFTNLFIILVVVTILANFIPSGTYERVVVDGRSVVDPATFTYAAEKSLAASLPSSCPSSTVLRTPPA